MAITTQKDGQTVVSYKGCVVSTFNREERVMSDVYAPVIYAIVYEADKGTFEQKYVRACFECDPGTTTAETDATPEIQSLYETYQMVQEAKSRLAEVERAFARAQEALKAPAKGRKCRVVKGRKVPVGTEGECIWMGHGDYGVRVGLKDAQGQVHWTAASNVEAMV